MISTNAFDQHSWHMHKQKTTKPKIPLPLKRGPKPKCKCGVCNICLNRIRVMRFYYKSKPGDISTAIPEPPNG